MKESRKRERRHEREGDQKSSHFEGRRREGGGREIQHENLPPSLLSIEQGGAERP
jgi:hypothetical protein